jgi:hypothetical protein
MKKVIVKNLEGVQTHGAQMEDPSAWIAECVEHDYWGKKERLALHKDEPMAESYDEADVLEEEIIESSDGVKKMVRLRAQYTIEIIDLDQDPEYLLQQCHAKRKAEYPSLGEFADAFVKMQNGDSSQMETYVASCLAIKAKYPKP